MHRFKIPFPPVKAYINPQTTWICEKLGLTDPLAALLCRTDGAAKTVNSFVALSGFGAEETKNQNDIDVNNSGPMGTENPDEIDLEIVETVEKAGVSGADEERALNEEIQSKKRIRLAEVLD